MQVHHTATQSGASTAAAWARQPRLDGFISFRGRGTPEPGLSVKVYRNLNRPSLFSIMAMAGPHKGKVVGYAPAILLRDVHFLISEKTRQAVLKRRVRTVHAFAAGILVTTSETLPDQLATNDQTTVTYSPYLSGHFHYRNEPDTAITHINKAWAWGSGLIVDTL